MCCLLPVTLFRLLSISDVDVTLGRCIVGHGYAIGSCLALTFFELAYIDPQSTPRILISVHHLPV